MKSRDILEAFRKGNINEKTISNFLFILNEKCDTNTHNLQVLAQQFEKMQNLIHAQLQIAGGLQKHYERMAKTLGLDPEATKGMDSESADNRIVMPGTE